MRDARERRDDARKLLANGVDPGEAKKAQKLARQELAANSFEVVAREWFGRNKKAWATSHAEKIPARLERDVFPWLGAKPVAEVKAPELLTIVRRIDARGANDTAHRALQNCGQVFRYAVATGRAERDPSGDLRGALSPLTHENFASITEPQAVGALLRALDAFKGSLVVKSALLLSPPRFRSSRRATTSRMGRY